MRRRRTISPVRSLLALLAASAAVAWIAAPALGYDHLPGVAPAGDVPYASASSLDVTSPPFDTSAFGEADEIVNPVAYLGCRAWGARTAWVRFSTAVSGNLRITVDSGPPGVGHDVFFSLYTAPSARASVFDLAHVDCHNGNNGAGAAGEDYVHGFRIAAGRTAYVQVLSVCADRVLVPYCDVDERAAAPGGPTTVRLRFVPDDGDRDGIPDTLDRCPAHAGPAALRGCPDSDGDGVADIDDRCAGVRGTDARGCDADRDGHVGRAHGGGDCDDRNPRVHPGAHDAPGNGIDEDCDGRDARHPRLRNQLTALAIWSPARRRHVGFAGPFRVAGPLFKGMTVRLRCQGRGCAFSAQTVVVRKRTAAVRIGRRLVGRRLRAGARLTLLVLRPGHVGIGKRYVLRARGRAKVVDLCVPAGKTAPRKRCA